MGGVRSVGGVTVVAVRGARAATVGRRVVALRARTRGGTSQCVLLLFIRIPGQLSGIKPT